LLTISGCIEKHENVASADQFVELMRMHDVDLQNFTSDHDYCDIPYLGHLSHYVENVVVYIAGFVVRRKTKQVHCNECL
jgi:hypothetical protein